MVAGSSELGSSNGLSRLVSTVKPVACRLAFAKVEFRAASEQLRLRLQSDTWISIRRLLRFAKKLGARKLLARESLSALTAGF